LIAVNVESAPMRTVRRASPDFGRRRRDDLLRLPRRRRHDHGVEVSR